MSLERANPRTSPEAVNMSICEGCEIDEKLLLCCPRFPLTGEQVDYKLPDGGKSRACLYLDADGRCSIYEKRPMGCRMFECDRMSSAKRDMRLNEESLPLCLRMMREETWGGG